jgi:AcrR family transcriptional regulator
MSDLRQTIIDASVSIIAKDGVRALSFREVARKAKVSHQAPYHYFENHFAILKAIAQDGFLMLTERMDSAAKPHQDPIRALNASGIAYVQFAVENLGYFRVMFQSPLISEKKQTEPLAEGEKAHGVLLALTKTAWESGIATNIDSETLALLCWSTVHGIATLITEGVVPHDAPKDSMKVGALVVEALSAHLQAHKRNPKLKKM